MLNRDYSSLVCSQCSTEHAGSAKDTVALYSPPSSGFRAVLQHRLWRDVVYPSPQAAPLRSLLSPPLLSLLPPLLLEGIPLLWLQRSTEEMQLQPSLCSLAWGLQGLGFPWHHNCQSHLLLHMCAESQA